VCDRLDHRLQGRRLRGRGRQFQLPQTGSYVGRGSGSRVCELLMLRGSLILVLLVLIGDHGGRGRPAQPFSSGITVVDSRGGRTQGRERETSGLCVRGGTHCRPRRCRCTATDSPLTRPGSGPLPNLCRSRARTDGPCIVVVVVVIAHHRRRRGT
jgi:hypothetical protein